MILNDANFCNYINNSFVFENKPRVAIAVSGGPDSMALLHLVNNWVKTKKGIVEALIVNHNIRENSKEEAYNVSKLLTDYKIKSKILNTNIKRVKKKNMNEARNNRYSLLTEYCKKEKILHLFVAHHLDDNLETFLLRRVSGSNFDGLASISKKVLINKINILRPLLNLSKKKIYKFNKINKIKYIEDPSNVNYRFSRPIIRKYLSDISFDKKKEIVNDFTLIKKNISKYKNMINEILFKNLDYVDSKIVKIDQNVLLKFDYFIAERIIQRIYSYLSNKGVSIRFSKIEILIKFIKTNNLKVFNLKDMKITKIENLLIFSLNKG